MRLLQFRGKLVEGGFEDIDACVVPNWLAGLEPSLPIQLIELIRSGLFHKPLQAELVVKEIQPALGDILSPRNGYYSGEVRGSEPVDHSAIGFRRDQDVAISQQ